MNKIAEKHFYNAAMNLDKKWWEEDPEDNWFDHEDFYHRWNKVIINYEKFGKDHIQ